MSEMITKNHALVARFGDTLDRLLDGIENFVANSRPTLGGERFLTDREVSARLKVSRRTLQDYRNNGMIAYYGWAARFSTRNRTLSGCLPPITGKRSDRIKIVLPSDGVRGSLIRCLRVSLTTLLCEEGIHPFREAAELCRHFLERLFLNNQNLHSRYCF